MDAVFTRDANSTRRTGITLKENRRDEYGMEEVDGIFSSPERSPERSPVRIDVTENGNDTVMGSEGMSMDEGMYPTAASRMKLTRGSNRKCARTSRLSPISKCAPSVVLPTCCAVTHKDRPDGIAATDAGNSIVSRGAE